MCWYSEIVSTGSAIYLVLLFVVTMDYFNAVRGKQLPNNNFAKYLDQLVTSLIAFPTLSFGRSIHLKVYGLMGPILILSLYIPGTLQVFHGTFAYFVIPLHTFAYSFILMNTFARFSMLFHAFECIASFCTLVHIITFFCVLLQQVRCYLNLPLHWEFIIKINAQPIRAP